MRARVVGGLLAAVVAVGAPAACGDDGTTATSGSAGSSSTTAAPAPSTTRTGIGSPTALADGTHFGYLRELIAGHEEIVGTFDQAELLTGDAALAASQAAGYEEPTDYFIRNDDDTERLPIVVDPEAEVAEIPYGEDRCCEPVTTDPASFSADLDRRSEQPTIVELTVQGGVVTRIEEQYFP